MPHCMHLMPLIMLTLQLSDRLASLASIVCVAAGAHHIGNIHRDANGSHFLIDYYRSLSLPVFPASLIRNKSNPSICPAGYGVSANTRVQY